MQAEVTLQESSQRERGRHDLNDSLKSKHVSVNNLNPALVRLLCMFISVMMSDNHNLDGAAFYRSKYLSIEMDFKLLVSVNFTFCAHQVTRLM